MSQSKVEDMASLHEGRLCQVLIVEVAGVRCALPLTEVVETMRPLPVEPLSDMPEFVRGIALIRGLAAPVVELTALFPLNLQVGATPASRFVTIRVVNRIVALAVERVLGIVELDGIGLEALPPLLKTARADAIQSIGSLDGELLAILQTARLLPESVWHTVDSHGGAQ